MTVVGFATKRAFGHFPYVGWKRSSEILASDSDPRLTPQCPSSELLREDGLELLLHQYFHKLLLRVNIRSQPLSSKLLEMSQDIPGPSCIFIAELPEPLPGGCRVERTPSGHGLQVIFRVFIQALWWNLDLGQCYQDAFWVLSHPLIWWWPYFIILDFSISLHLWIPFSLHPRTLQKDFSDSCAGAPRKAGWTGEGEKRDAKPHHRLQEKGQFGFSWCVCPAFGLLGRMAVPFPAFWGNSTLFSIVAVLVCIPPNTV